MSPYPFQSITVNGRNVRIQEITSGVAVSQNDFERDLFHFISEWLGGTPEFLLQTSGSTGSPKKITVTRDQMVASAAMTARALDLKQGYVSLVCLNPAYIAGKMMLARSFVTGMEIIAVTPSGNPLTNLTSQKPIDFTAMVPLQIHEGVRSVYAPAFNSIKTILVGGGALDEESRLKIQEYTCNFYATYGMTETLSHVALRLLNGPSASEEYRALPGITIGKDIRNCLTIDWSVLPSTIVTNDLVEITGASTFKWIGRWDNVINTGGVKVIPETVEIAIEQIFRDLKIQRQFFISSVADQKLGNKIVLVIEGELTAAELEKLKHALNHSLQKHEVPKEIVNINRFILTETGKINRKSTLNLT